MTLSTEDVNPFSIDIGEWDVETISSFIHLSDIAAYEAVGKAMSKISEACKMILESLENGGRVIYLGAGTVDYVHPFVLGLCMGLHSSYQVFSPHLPFDEVMLI